MEVQGLLSAGGVSIRLNDRDYGLTYKASIHAGRLPRIINLMEHSVQTSVDERSVASVDADVRDYFVGESAPFRHTTVSNTYVIQRSYYLA